MSDDQRNVVDLPRGRRRRDPEVETRQRSEAITLLLAGVSLERIAETLGVSGPAVHQMVTRALGTVAHRPEQVALMRSIENARLDRAQAAIWPQVVAGDLNATQVFLKISARRARLNGLDAPTQVHVALNVRAEMESALHELEQVVLGEVVK